jgi:hypothetical protein
MALSCRCLTLSCGDPGVCVYCTFPEPRFWPPRLKLPFTKMNKNPPGIFFADPDLGTHHRNTHGERRDGKCATLVMIDKLSGAMPELKGSDFVISTPYCKNLARLEAALKAHPRPACRGVVVNTTDSSRAVRPGGRLCTLRDERHKSSLRCGPASDLRLHHATQ